jgi:hypothetical protein
VRLRERRIEGTKEKKEQAKMSCVASVNCPLSDCTLAVDNAENIRNSNDKALLGLKVDTTAAILIAPSTRKNAHSNNAVNAAVGAEKAPSVRRASAVGSTRKVNARTVAVAASSASTTLEVHRPSALDLHIFAKPFTPCSTPRRNDPYSLCLLNSPCTPEDSFYACYSETAPVAVVESEAVAASMQTPVRSCGTSAGSTSHKATLGETTRNLLDMFSLVSTPSKSPCCVTPVRPTEVSTTASPTSPERAASPPSPVPSARVVRKVVSCNVDRTSGRPVPKPKVV